MEVALEEVIKNIIHIDKSAAELKKNMAMELDRRKEKIEDEISMLRGEIVEDTLKKADEEWAIQLEAVKNEAQSVISLSQRKAAEMYESFQGQKEEIIREIFKDIVNG